MTALPDLPCLRHEAIGGLEHGTDVLRTAGTVSRNAATLELLARGHDTRRALIEINASPVRAAQVAASLQAIRSQQ